MELQSSVSGAAPGKKPDETGERFRSPEENGHRIAFPLIVIGASAGGLEVIKKLVKELPKNLGAAVLIVWHMSPDVRGILPYILNRQGTLEATNAYDGEEIQINRIYVATPDHHLVVEGDKMRVTKGPKENRFRPAVDPLFRSAAYYYGEHVIGVILSGALDDGTAGLWTVKECGGIALVQDPLEAEVPSMPRNALLHVDVDYTVPVAEMPRLLIQLVKDRAVSMPVTNMENDNKTNIEVQIAADESGLNTGVMTLGELVPFTCPECHGVLTAIAEGTVKRYRCHTGHAFSMDTLLTAMTEYIEETLWTAIRSIKETTMLMNNVGDHFAEHNNPKLAALYFKKAKEAEQRAKVVRDVVINHEQLSKDSLLYESEAKQSV